MRKYNKFYKELWWKIVEVFTKPDLGKYDVKPCQEHRLAFAKECPETTNIKGLSVCPICGFLFKDLLSKKGRKK